MTHLSSDKPERGVAQTLGIIATAIKQQEQLNESHFANESQFANESHFATTDYSQVAIDMDKTQAAISAFTNSETITNINDDESDVSDPLDTEHDVFQDFISKGDDPNIDILDQIQIAGSLALRVKIRILLEKFRSVFATTLPSEPAIIPLFELNVGKEKWEQFSNRGPQRVQSPLKQAEILKQDDELLRTGVIEPSKESYYSQVILASKPDDTWRFCTDSRKLNDCTQSASWPIPNTKEMLGCLGTHHSNVFGVMDLTAGGYHQAFICFCGIFQFRRLSFGLKRALSYF
jgi:hypothetical protein